MRDSLNSPRVSRVSLGRPRGDAKGPHAREPGGPTQKERGSDSAKSASAPRVPTMDFALDPEDGFEWVRAHVDRSYQAQDLPAHKCSCRDPDFHRKVVLECCRMCLPHAKPGSKHCKRLREARSTLQNTKVCQEVCICLMACALNYKQTRFVQHDSLFSDLSSYMQHIVPLVYDQIEREIEKALALRPWAQTSPELTDPNVLWDDTLVASELARWLLSKLCAMCNYCRNLLCLLSARMRITYDSVLDYVKDTMNQLECSHKVVDCRHMENWAMVRMIELHRRRLNSDKPSFLLTTTHLGNRIRSVPSCLLEWVCNPLSRAVFTRNLLTASATALVHTTHTQQIDIFNRNTFHLRRLIAGENSNECNVCFEAFENLPTKCLILCPMCTFAFCDRCMAKLGAKRGGECPHCRNVIADCPSADHRVP